MKLAGKDKKLRADDFVDRYVFSGSMGVQDVERLYLAPR